jgi:photosystem II stability/assembly factor-like uncharacterized protein
MVGLAGAEVRSFHVAGDSLYAATDRGVYRRVWTGKDTAWTLLGLEDREVTSVVRLPDNHLLAGTAGAEGESVTLFRSPDAGQTWLPFQGGFGGDASRRGAGNLLLLRSGILLATGQALVIARSTDLGATWMPVWGSWTLSGEGLYFLEPDPLMPTGAWAGGAGAFFQPLLFRTDDGGESWEDARSPTDREDAHYDLAVNLWDPGVLVSAMSGRVVRSTDGAQSWATVLEPDHPTFFRAVSFSDNVPDRAFAAGSIINGGVQQEVVLYASDDGGSTWYSRSDHQTRQGRVLSMLVASRAGVEFVFIGTDRGVHRFSAPPDT